MTAKRTLPTFSVHSQHVFLLLLVTFFFTSLPSASAGGGHDFTKGESSPVPSRNIVPHSTANVPCLGLLVSYSSFVEVLDPETGDVWAKSVSLTENGLITGLTVRDASPEQVTALAVEMVNDTTSNLIQVQLSRDNTTAAHVLLKGKAF